MTSGLAGGGWLEVNCCCSLVPALAAVERRAGRAGGRSSSSPLSSPASASAADAAAAAGGARGEKLLLVDVLVRLGVGGGGGFCRLGREEFGRGAVAVAVEVEEDDLLSWARMLGELVVTNPSPVEVEVRAEGFVGFGGGRFCEVGLEEADEAAVSTAEPMGRWMLLSGSEMEMGRCDNGVALRGAGGAGAVFVDA